MIPYTFAMPDEHVFVNAGFDFCDGVGARLVGHSLSLKGNIGVNFYMDLDESVADSDTAYMYFTIPGDTVTYQTVYVNEQSDASLPHAEKKTVGDKTYYVFPCSVAAKEIYSDITAQIIDGEDHGDRYTYSVKEYADYLLENANDKGTDEQKAYYAAKPLVEKMLNTANTQGRTLMMKLLIVSRTLRFPRILKAIQPACRITIPLRARRSR